MKYNGIIERKLALLDDQVQKLRNYTKEVTYDLFEKNWAMRAASERAVQVAAEIIIDIAERIIAIEHAGPVGSAADAVEKLVTLGVLDSAEPYRSIVRFRNLIVHEYEQIDPKILFDLVARRLGDFLKFRDELDRN
ncbi:MAG TPA: DUF86 domain-containing protein [Spirochaetia bacterium]|nr:DUF86 domain-containing protein [Spirochaetia bacterium]